ncbi:GNAT family N-acetyltransferase [Haloglomus irregulare]|jgi:GNAT superfamily N-acetyltransferase|uniref:GNAT family N-acetyltransferase n=1 Tax=Haloglomus irregulare TaxID=2234134 RepID=A0A554NCY7_9EURY|nr:GNAT family N-acetyltransferase [Haloglomus irregulare]TSD15228.1 GNAT family N-acetyltransferase [Haloglomus irregulare]
MEGSTVAYALLGWPADGPTLRLDHREFAYAGKFVMSATGKAVAYRDGDPADPEAVLAAAAFDADRTDEATLKIRYLTVRQDARGGGLGARLAAFVAARAAGRGFDRVAIGVNNAFSYEALSKAGFAWTGAESGLAELVLARPAETPADRDPGRYRDGLDRFREREGLTPAERAFLDDRRGADPPAPVTPPGPDATE